MVYKDEKVYIFFRKVMDENELSLQQAAGYQVGFAVLRR
jgi:hypothetical protein